MAHRRKTFFRQTKVIGEDLQSPSGLVEEAGIAHHAGPILVQRPVQARTPTQRQARRLDRRRAICKGRTHGQQILLQFPLPFRRHGFQRGGAFLVRFLQEAPGKARRRSVLGIVGLDQAIDGGAPALGDSQLAVDARGALFERPQRVRLVRRQGLRTFMWTAARPAHANVARRDDRNARH